MTHLGAVLSLFAAMAFTGANVAAGKALVEHVPVYVLITLRFAIASLALAPLAAREAGPALTSLTRRQWIELLLSALFGMVLFTTFLLEGTKRTAAADAGIITATLPAVIALAGVVLMGDRLGRAQAGAVVLAVAGLALVQVTGAAAGSSALLGNMLVGLAVLSEAAWVLITKRLSAALSPVRLTLAGNVAALVMCLPLAATDLASFDAASVPTATWVLVVWYALSASVFCQVLWFRGARHVETWLAGLATAAVPIVALAASSLALGEIIGPWRLTGAALVIAAIVLGALSSRPRSPVPPLV